MMSKSGGVSNWQVDQGFDFEQHFDATYVVSVVGDVVFGVMLVMQTVLYFSELFYDVR